MVHYMSNSHQTKVQEGGGGGEFKKGKEMINFTV